MDKEIEILSRFLQCLAKEVQEDYVTLNDHSDFIVRFIADYDTYNRDAIIEISSFLLDLSFEFDRKFHG